MRKILAFVFAFLAGIPNALAVHNLIFKDASEITQGQLDRDRTSGGDFLWNTDGVLFSSHTNAGAGGGLINNADGVLRASHTASGALGGLVQNGLGVVVDSMTVGFLEDNTNVLRASHTPSGLAGGLIQNQEGVVFGSHTARGAGGINHTTYTWRATQTFNGSSVTFSAATELFFTSGTVSIATNKYFWPSTTPANDAAHVLYSSVTPGGGGSGVNLYWGKLPEAVDTSDFAQLNTTQTFTGQHTFVSSHTISTTAFITNLRVGHGPVTVPPGTTLALIAGRQTTQMAVTNNSTLVLGQRQDGGNPTLVLDNAAASQGHLIQNNGGTWEHYAGATGGLALRMDIDNTSPHVQVTGDLNITGTLTKGGGTFQIPHPSKQDKWLMHGFVESDKYGLTYDGMGQLSAGAAVVSLPDWFEIVCATDSRTVQLTPVGGWSPLYVEGKIADGQFTVKTAVGGDPAQKFFWQVNGRRGDPFIMALDNGLAHGDGRMVVERSIVPGANDLKRESEALKLDVSDPQVKADSIKRMRSKYRGFEGEKIGISNIDPVK